MVKSKPVFFTALDAKLMSVAAVRMGKGLLLQIDVLGTVPKTFRINIWGMAQATSHGVVEEFRDIPGDVVSFSPVDKDGPTSDPCRRYTRSNASSHGRQD